MTEITTNLTDLTPVDWSIPESMFLEKTKRLLRRLCIPPYLKAIHPILKNKYANQLPFSVDQWYWGGRGMAMEILHRKVCRFAGGVKGKTILVVGCGTGRDMPSWLTKKPAKVIGVDCFNYLTAWQQIQKNHPETPITFIQADLEQLSSALTEPVDLIVSDAVFEHIRYMDRVLPQLHREIDLITGGLMAVYHA